MAVALAKPAAGEAPSIVRLGDIRFAWPGEGAFSLAVKDFALPARQRILLIGPSGSGKSTFLSLLCGILAPQSGRIEILGQDLTRLGAAARDAFRAEHFGIIFQMFNLLPYGSVVDNVLLPLSFAPGRRRRASASGSAAEEAGRLLARLGLQPSLVRKQSAASLSVGQQQRVAAARALIGAPEIVVADEPTSALDRDRQGAFLDLLFAETGAAGAALIMVSHDETLAPRFDRVLRLADIATTSPPDGRPERRTEGKAEGRPA
jgi:putative ABC transport system ATP-binding protein